ncbi:Ig domain-containing protein [Vibrio sp. 10N.261.45.A4]|uniref:Ig-like domain-containing protein n=1 Tax=Vibrio sp. 10N.261.45.A4 TaxID=3229655 RepID=UPI0035531573
MSPLEQQKAKQDGVFSKALRDASNAFVQMGAHPRTLLHHSRRNDLIEQAIAKLHTLKREGDAYHQMGKPALQATANIDDESEDKLKLEPVGFRKVDDSPIVYSELGVDVQSGGLNFVLNNPYEQIVKYTSSDEAVATVDEKLGLITPVGDGEVTIYVALTKKGEYPRVEDSVDLVIADEPKEDSEPSPDDEAQSDNNASESGLDK